MKKSATKREFEEEVQRLVDLLEQNVEDPAPEISEYRIVDIGCDHLMKASDLYRFGDLYMMSVMAAAARQWAYDVKERQFEDMVERKLAEGKDPGDE